MSNGGFFLLGSIEAMRPVFLIVMGVFMLIFAWRLAKKSDTWTSRLMMAGALLLAFGYALMLPLYEAGILERYAPNKLRYEGSAATAMGWHAIKLVVMNAGWLVFGIGLAMHAKILCPSPAENPRREAPAHNAHEFTA
jgi:uncharacterized membrane protein